MDPRDLHRAVEAALASKRLGSPVCVRYFFSIPLKGRAVVDRLAWVVGAIDGWLDQQIHSVHAVGSAAQGRIVLTLSYRGGAAAQVGWSNGRGSPGVDVTVLGNHGILYHDAGTGDPGEPQVPAGEFPPVRKEIVDLLQRALREGLVETEAKG